MAANPAVRSLIEAEVKRLTTHVGQWETIKRFALLPEDFTFDNGSLTFTLKLKRRVVEQNYREVIDKLYTDTSDPVPSKSRS
jgi:long-chain acyl-CoA synthetase